MSSQPSCPAENIDNILAILDRRSGSLLDMLGTLHARLDRALRPPSPEPRSEAGEDKGPISKLADELSAVADRLQMANELVDNILGRIDFGMKPTEPAKREKY